MMSPEVLLIDSNRTVAGLVVKALRQSIPNISIEYASRVPQALDFLFRTGKYAARTSAQPPNLVVLSLNLANNGSREILRVLKAYTRIQTIPVLVLAEPSTPIAVLEQCQMTANALVMTSENRGKFMRDIASAGAYFLNAGTSQSTRLGADNSSDHVVVRH